MSLMTQPKVELALGGSWRGQIFQAAPLGWWRLADQASTATDDSGNGYDGTVFGSGGLVQFSDVPEGGGYLFCTGDTAVTMGDVAAFEFTSDFTVEVIASYASTTEQILVSKFDRTALSGWGVSILGGGTGRLRFFGFNGGVTLWDVNTASSYNDGLVHHIVWKAFNVTGNTQIEVYIDGIIIAASTTLYVGDKLSALPATAAPLLIGAWQLAGVPAAFFVGGIDEVVIFNGQVSASDIHSHSLASKWTDVSTDLVASQGLSFSRGISGFGPTDRIAEVGTCAFTLNNTSQHHTRGYYSPLSANRVPNFNSETLCRISVGTSVQWTGRLGSINPDAGQYRDQYTHVDGVDVMNPLTDAICRAVPLEVSQLETTLMTAVIEAIPILARPLSLTFDGGADTVPYAFDRLETGQLAIQILSNIAISSIGYIWPTKLGGLRYENRLQRAAASSAMTVTNTMQGLSVPCRQDHVYNHVICTCHPKTVDAAATTIVWTEEGTPPTMLTGQVDDFWVTYSVPSTFNPNVMIGALDQIAPVATTDYTSNTAADGSGTDKTANLSVVATYFASTIHYVVTNNDASTVYRTLLQARGKGVYDLGPQNLEASTTALRTVERAITIDLPFQDSRTYTQAIADYFLSAYSDATVQAGPSSVESMTLAVKTDSALLTTLLALEIGQKITITETQTGVSSLAAFIQQITWSVAIGGPWYTCTLGLSPIPGFT